MKTFKQIVEATNDTAVMVFGRFNPPTIGHAALLMKAEQVANKNRGKLIVYASKSQDAKKNPLPPKIKLKYMKLFWPGVDIRLPKGASFIDAATDLYSKNIKNLIVIAGSDRIKEYKTLLEKYNGVKARHGFYDFDSIKVVSAGERDPDAEGVSGMSASKMREAAAKDDFKSFKKGVPDFRSKNLDKQLFDELKRYMGVN